MKSFFLWLRHWHTLNLFLKSLNEKGWSGGWNMWTSTTIEGFKFIFDCCYIVRRGYHQIVSQIKPQFSFISPKQKELCYIQAISSYTHWWTFIIECMNGIHSFTFGKISFVNQTSRRTYSDTIFSVCWQPTNYFFSCRFYAKLKNVYIC